jgi:cytochrome c553
MKKLIVAALLSSIASAPLFAADAKENWGQYCAKCHGTDGAGKTKMGQKLKVKDYTDAAVQAQFSDEQLAKVTREGSTKDGRELMKGFKDDLSEADITALVAFIRGMKK